MATEKRLIYLDELMKFPIRIDHYDKVNGNEHFVYGVETVLEYAENLPTVDAVPMDEIRVDFMSICLENQEAILNVSICGKPNEVKLPFSQDVAEVVRCKDCVYCSTKRSKRYNQLLRFCEWGEGYTKVDSNGSFFCAHGKRSKYATD